MASACFFGLPAFNSVFKFRVKQFCEAHLRSGILCFLSAERSRRWGVEVCILVQGTIVSVESSIDHLLDLIVGML